MIMGSFYLIKQMILSLKNKNKIIVVTILGIINIIFNYILNLKPYYLWFFVLYIGIKIIIYSNICKLLNKRCEVFNGMIYIFYFKIYSIKKFDLLVKNKIPFETVDKNKLEHCLNATITKMELVKGKKNQFLASFIRGKISDYMKLPKGSMERLEAILISFKGKVKHINSYENEVEWNHEFITNINPKKLNRELVNIEHKLGCKKNTLSFDQNNGIVKFSIKKDEQKIYILDEYIGGVRKPQNMQLPFILGMNYRTGSVVVKDLIDVLHLLIAGKTGSGKSVTFKCIIESLMYWNQNCCFYMLDFAESALTRYEDFTNTKYVESDFESIKEAIKELREEMAVRMKAFRNNNVENIKEYNRLIPDQKIPYIVFCIDEANGFKEDLEKEQFEEIKNEIKALLKRGRKYGMVILFAVQQTNDQDFCKSWKTQTTRLGHLLSDHIDCSNLTTNKEIAIQLPNLGKGEFYLLQEGKEVEKMKGCFTSKEHDKLFNVLKEVYNEKNIPEVIEEIQIEEKTENATNNTENATNKNTSIG